MDLPPAVGSRPSFANNQSAKSCLRVGHSDWASTQVCTSSESAASSSRKLLIRSRTSSRCCSLIARTSSQCLEALSEVGGLCFAATHSSCWRSILFLVGCSSLQCLEHGLQSLVQRGHVTVLFHGIGLLPQPLFHSIHQRCLDLGRGFSSYSHTATSNNSP